jgi:hypothetical protein
MTRLLYTSKPTPIHAMIRVVVTIGGRRKRSRVGAAYVAYIPSKIATKAKIIPESPVEAASIVWYSASATEVVMDRPRVQCRLMGSLPILISAYYRVRSSDCQRVA